QPCERVDRSPELQDGRLEDLLDGFLVRQTDETHVVRPRRRAGHDGFPCSSAVYKTCAVGCGCVHAFLTACAHLPAARTGDTFAIAAYDHPRFRSSHCETTWDVRASIKRTNTGPRDLAWNITVPDRARRRVRRVPAVRYLPLLQHAHPPFDPR